MLNWTWILTHSCLQKHSVMMTILLQVERNTLSFILQADLLTHFDILFPNPEGIFEIKKNRKD